MPNKKTKKVEKKVNYKDVLFDKDSRIFIIVQSLIFALFISFGNSYLVLQLCGPEYFNFLELFLMLVPLYFVLFICFIINYIKYICKKNGK